MSNIRQRQSDNHSSSTWRDFNPLTRVVFLQRVMLYVPHSAKRYHELALTTEPFFDTIFTPEHGVTLLHRWSAQERQLAVQAQVRSEHSRHKRRHDCVPLLALLLTPPLRVDLQQAAASAVANGRVDCVALLLVADVDLCAAALRDGTDFVSVAAVHGRSAVLKLLLNAGCAFDVPRKKDGCRPLHCASAFGRAECVSQLLGAGADKDAVNNDGKTARDLAMGGTATLGRQKVLDLLR